jgi:hypothetical protein
MYRSIEGSIILPLYETAPAISATIDPLPVVIFGSTFIKHTVFACSLFGYGMVLRVMIIKRQCHEICECVYGHCVNRREEGRGRGNYKL